MIALHTITADGSPVTYSVDPDQFAAAMLALALIVMMLAIIAVLSWRR